MMYLLMGSTNTLNVPLRAFPDEQLARDWAGVLTARVVVLQAKRLYGLDVKLDDVECLHVIEVDDSGRMNRVPNPAARDFDAERRLAVILQHLASIERDNLLDARGPDRVQPAGGSMAGPPPGPVPHGRAEDCSSPDGDQG